jgi:hypothetical protein
MMILAMYRETGGGEGRNCWFSLNSSKIWKNLNFYLLKRWYMWIRSRIHKACFPFRAFVIRHNYYYKCCYCYFLFKNVLLKDRFWFREIYRIYGKAADTAVPLWHKFDTESTLRGQYVDLFVNYSWTYFMHLCLIVIIYRTKAHYKRNFWTVATLSSYNIHKI